MLYYGGVVKCIRKQAAIIRMSKAFYSRRNSSNYERYYKVVGKVTNTKKANEYDEHALAPIPNWELLTPQGYRFFMPGNVGPAWHDTYSTAHSLPQDFDLESTNLECFAQECPILLRQAATELFPGIDTRYNHMTIISLSQKRLKLGITEPDGEEFAKKFVLTAQEICRKLKRSGYWSDFINPFSGLPCVNVYSSTLNLYQTDPRFRCLGFRITEHQNCRIIEEKNIRRFIGSLFTTAPANADILKKILLCIDED